jgi:hypothetical protein
LDALALGTRGVVSPQAATQIPGSRPFSLRKLLKRMAGTTGLEPAASAVTGQRSNQLNYVPYSVILPICSSEPPARMRHARLPTGSEVAASFSPPDVTESYDPLILTASPGTRKRGSQETRRMTRLPSYKSRRKMLNIVHMRGHIRA